MSVIPDSLLEELYHRGSLCNAAEGFELVLRNELRSLTLVGLYGLEMDGDGYPPDRLALRTADGVSLPAAEITTEASLSLPQGLALTLRGVGIVLAEGTHRFTLFLRTLEIGDLAIHAEDHLRQAGQGEAAEEQVEEPQVEEPQVEEPQVEEPQVGEEPPAAPQVSEEPLAAPQVGEEPLGAPQVAQERPAAIRPIKVAILGAGSTVFARQLMSDILCTPGLERGTFALVDVEPERLELARRIGGQLVTASGRDWSVQATADRLEALPGCDYLINTIEVAGLRNVRPDYEIPLKYGVDQCIGDTIGPGGIFKMLRTGPVWLDILHDAERLCPQAVVLNYTNPMSALTLLALKATGLAVVGLCHSVQGTSHQLADYLDVPYEELRFRCAGINHLAWFTELTCRGEELLPRLRQAAQDPEIYERDPVRFEILLHFGAFVTESSGHFSEYVPYFRKRPDLLARYTRDGYLGESGFYAHNWPHWRAAAEQAVRTLLAAESAPSLVRSSEYASVVVEAIESGRPAVIHGNVRNTALIDNLPAGGCVEVPVLVDRTGLHPTYFGPLPPQLAALDAAHMYVHELMVEAVLARDKRAALHALMLDPLTAAVCSPEEIRRMFDEMWAAERPDLAAFEV